jgi:hypothetical protein
MVGKKAGKCPEFDPGAWLGRAGTQEEQSLISKHLQHHRDLPDNGGEAFIGEPCSKVRRRMRAAGVKQQAGLTSVLTEIAWGRRRDATRPCRRLWRRTGPTPPRTTPTRSA